MGWLLQVLGGSAVQTIAEARYRASNPVASASVCPGGQRDPTFPPHHRSHTREHVFDLSWIADLDADGACRAVEATQVELRERELHELALAARWAVLHGPQTLLARYHRPPMGAGGPRGGERCRRLGGDGTPEVTEFACAELAVVMGIGPMVASSLMGDALDLRHRHPVMWAALVAGGGRVWKARQVVRRVHAAGLCVADARAVDARVTPYVDSLSWASFLRLVDAEIIAVDPAAAEKRRRARELEQFVSAGQSDEHGLKTLIARAEAGEVIVFLAMVSRIGGCQMVCVSGRSQRRNEDDCCDRGNRATGLQEGCCCAAC